jgi:DNA-binding transcriptional LysR family regulator
MNAPVFRRFGLPWTRDTGMTMNGSRMQVQFGFRRLPYQVDMLAIDARALEAFRAVAETGSATAAAALLNTTQPSVTRIVAELEKTCGFKLFERGRFGMRTTPAGEAVLNSVQRHFAGMKAIERTIRDVRGSVHGALWGIAIPALAEGSLGRILGHFLKVHPNVSAKLATGNEMQVLNGVLSHEYDCGAIVGALPPGADLAVLPIDRRRLTLALAPDHPLANRDTVHVRELDGEDIVLMPAPHFLRSAFDAMLINFGVRPRRAHEAPTQRGVATLVQHGGGVGIVDSDITQSLVAASLRAVPLEPEISWTTNLIYWPQHNRSAASDAFVSWLKSARPEESGLSSPAAPPNRPFPNFRTDDQRHHPLTQPSPTRGEG